MPISEQLHNNSLGTTNIRQVEAPRIGMSKKCVITNSLKRFVKKSEAK